MTYKKKITTAQRKVDHFSIFNSLFTKVAYTLEEIEKYYKPFLANRQLMNLEEYVFLINNLNELNLSPSDHYSTLFKLLPKKLKAPFLKFNNVQKKNDEYVKMLASYYNCSYRVAHEYLKFVYMDEKLKQEIEYRWHEKHGGLKEYMESQNHKYKGMKK